MVLKRVKVKKKFTQIRNRGFLVPIISRFHWPNLVRGSPTEKGKWWLIDGPEVEHLDLKALDKKRLYGKVCCVLLEIIPTPPNPFDI